MFLLKELLSKRSASLNDQVETLKKSYKEAVDTIIYQEICLKSARAEIDQLKLNKSQLMQHKVEMQKQILIDTKQEFMDYQKMCMEKAGKLEKITKEKLPKWLLDELDAKAETDQLTLLHLVNEVTSANRKDNNETIIPKQEIHLINIPDNALSNEDANKCEENYYPHDHKADRHLNEGTTSEVCIL